MRSSFSKFDLLCKKVIYIIIISSKGVIAFCSLILSKLISNSETTKVVVVNLQQEDHSQQVETRSCWRHKSCGSFLLNLLSRPHFHQSRRLHAKRPSAVLIVHVLRTRRGFIGCLRCASSHFPCFWLMGGLVGFLPAECRHIPSSSAPHTSILFMCASFKLMEERKTPLLVKSKHEEQPDNGMLGRRVGGSSYGESYELVSRLWSTRVLIHIELLPFHKWWRTPCWALESNNDSCG